MQSYAPANLSVGVELSTLKTQQVLLMKPLYMHGGGPYWDRNQDDSHHQHRIPLQTAVIAIGSIVQFRRPPGSAPTPAHAAALAAAAVPASSQCPHKYPASKPTKGGRVCPGPDGPGTGWAWASRHSWSHAQPRGWGPSFELPHLDGPLTMAESYKFCG